MLSQERRLERYRIIYTWKSLEKLIPDCGITSHFSTRRGRIANIPSLSNTSSCRVKTIRDGSFQVNGPRLFNSLPPAIRNIANCSVEVFKLNLDTFLSTIPDEPCCDDLKPRALNQVTGKFSNSVIDQVNHLYLT